MIAKITLWLLVSLCISNVIGKVDIYSARVESCRGCSLNRLPEVKNFIYNDLPQYEGVEFKPIQGAPPELVLLDEAERELERLPLAGLSRDQCNALLVEKGFVRGAGEANTEL